MKVIIAGSRTIAGLRAFKLVLAGIRMAEAEGWDITEVVCGEARGIDRAGRRWGETHGVPVRSFPVDSADWDMHGKRAGFLRNEQMANYADALIAITNGSPGTRSMIQIARSRKMPVVVVEVP